MITQTLKQLFSDDILEEDNDIIKGMIRFIKKWWFLRQLYKECGEHSKKESIDFFLLNSKYQIERASFLKQITKQIIGRFSNILWWRKKDNPEKTKKIMNEYNSIIDSCIAENYIEKNKIPIALEKLRNQEGRIFIRTTTKGEDILGYFPLIQELLSRYKLVWIMIITPFVPWFLKSLLKSLGEFINSLIGL